MESTAVAIKQQAIAPLSMRDLAEIGKAFEQSGMFGCSQQGQGMVLAMTCQMAGMTPLEFIETYHIVKGKPSMRADAMLARLLELGGKYEVIIRDATRAGIKASFRDATVTITMSWDEAKQEPFVYDDAAKTKIKHNWATPRARTQMLWARVASDAVRTVCPLANKGSYTPEEIEDFRSEAPTEHAPSKQVDPKTITIPTSEPPAVEAPTVTQPSTVQVSTTEAPPQTTTPETTTPEVVDYNVMPIGKQAGKKWAEMNDAQLAKVIAMPPGAYPQITEQHVAAVKAEIERRKQAAQ